MNPAPKIEVKQLAVIVKLSDGTCRQVRLTKRQADIVLHYLPTIVEKEVLPILETVLPLDLEDYRAS
jgi:hypothetical protein